MLLDVWADLTCPWCFLGSVRLDRALSLWQGEAEVVWRPFQLNPAARRPSERLVGPASTVLADHADHLAELDLPYRPTWRANTFDAHRLLAAGYEQGGAALQNRLARRLFVAHFAEGVDLADRAELDRLAAEVGLPDAGDLIDDPNLFRHVREELMRGLTIGVRAVPTFVIDGRAVAGAQEPAVLLDFLNGGLSPADQAPGGTACSVPSTEPPRIVPTGDPAEDFRRAEDLVAARNPLGAVALLEPMADQPAVRPLLARAYFASAQLGRAQHLLERLTDERPTDDYAHFLLGRTLERRHRYREALTHMKLAGALDNHPDYAAGVTRLTDRLARPYDTRV
ncbi:MAG TPA: DsbA family protein [Pseudonocardiaceae bacterium]|nr:DsbA family protein [Pseudonocardiaceae bacterium]